MDRERGTISGDGARPCFFVRTGVEVPPAAPVSFFGVRSSNSRLATRPSPSSASRCRLFAEADALLPGESGCGRLRPLACGYRWEGWCEGEGGGWRGLYAPGWGVCGVGWGAGKREGRKSWSGSSERGWRVMFVFV